MFENLDFRNGFRTSITVTLAAIIALALHSDDPWWAAMSALVVADANWLGVWRTATQKLLGTFGGGVTGYWLAIFTKNYEFFQIITLFLLAVFAIYKRNTSPYGYAWLLYVVTAMIAIFVSLYDVENLYTVMIDRTFSVSIGVCTSAFVSYFFIETSSLAAPIEGKKPTEISHEWMRSLAIAAGVTTIAAPVVFVGQELIAMLQIAITSLVILYGPFKSVRQLVLSRFFGCFVGGIFGLLFVQLSLQSFFWWCVVLALGMFFFASLHHSKGRWWYAGTQAGYAYLICALASRGPVVVITPVLDRLFGIIVGTVISAVVIILVHVWFEKISLYKWLTHED